MIQHLMLDTEAIELLDSFGYEMTGNPLEAIPVAVELSKKIYQLYISQVVQPHVPGDLMELAAIYGYKDSKYKAKGAIQAYVQQETEKAYDKGRIAEAKVCEQAQRHDGKQAVLKGRIDSIDKVFGMSPGKSFNLWKPADALRFYERLKEYEHELKAALKAKGATHE